ncbi:sensor histidine kinase [Streptomyces sp. NRRL WC-3626]|uniref:sensor histidine kinase n=1 Tax=Streptomyces sp. NRRL WC-3626 TaxID=1463926 RepID=UPI00068EC97B|nr:histidine kinase [Streptomyces sp. NRRL WC-3626]
MQLKSSCRANGLCQPGVSRLLALLITATLAVSVLVHSSLRDRTHPATEVVMVPLLAGVLLALQVGVFITQRSGRDGGPARRAAVALVGQILVVALSAEVLDVEFCVLAGYLAGTLPLVLQPRYAWPLFAVVVITGPLAATRADGSPVHLVSMGLGLLVTGLMAFILSSTMLMVRHLRQSRADFARAAVQNEQSRFARDLHDLLGHTLSALAMRAELLHRTFQSRPELAAAQTDQLLRTARQSMAEVRMAVRGYRELPLFSEVRAAASLLDTVGIDVTLQVTALPSRGEAGTALSAVLRECVTNMLRHSDVSRCAVLLTAGPGTVRLEVVNDGATRAGRGSSPGGGSGLGNLRQRVTALGGTLESRRSPGGTFRVVAVVPSATLSVPPGASAHLQTSLGKLANAA